MAEFPLDELTPAERHEGLVELLDDCASASAELAKVWRAGGVGSYSAAAADRIDVALTHALHELSDAFFHR